MSKNRTVLIRISCKDRTDIPARVYEARVGTPGAWPLCKHCGALVPPKGDELHTIARVGK